MPHTDNKTRRWWVLAAMGTAGGLIMLDESILGVALPSLRRDLGLDAITSHWVINAYFLTFTGFAAAGGKLTDIIGLRKAIVGSIAIFGLASLVAGFTQDAYWLIGARIVQGIAAGIIYPAALGMVTAAFPEDERGGAIGALAAIATSFLMLGPLIGGFFTEMLSWRWIFWINIPMTIAVVGIVLAIWTDPPRDSKPTSFFAIELVILLTGVGAVVFAIMQAPDWGWLSPTILISGVGGLIVLILFVVVERRRDTPLIDVRLFGDLNFTACNLIFAAGQFTKISVVVFVALYLQHVLGLSPMTSGLCLVVAVIGVPLLSTPSGKLADRIGVRVPALFGMIGIIMSVLWIAIFTGADHYALLIPGLVCWGFMLPFCFIPTGQAAMGSVPPEKHGQASGIVTTMRLFGGTLGMAVSSTLLVATGSYRTIFLVNCGVLFAVFVFGFFFLERKRGDRPA